MAIETWPEESSSHQLDLLIEKGERGVRLGLLIFSQPQTNVVYLGKKQKKKKTQKKTQKQQRKGTARKEMENICLVCGFRALK